MRARRVKLDGARDLKKALAQLEKHTTAKSTAVRAMKEAAKPLASRMEMLAPWDRGTLSRSIAISTKLSKRQKKIFSKIRKISGGAAANVFVGPSYDLGDGGRHGHLLEFGTVAMAAQPFARPAWAMTQHEVLAGIKSNMWTEIDKAAKRQAKRNARRK